MKRIELYSRIFFDFNGTLLDDVWLGIRSVNRMLKKRGLSRIATLEDYYRVFGFPIEDYYRRLGFDFDKEPYSLLAVEWINNYREEEKNLALRAGAKEFLQYCQSKHMPLYILSATEKNMLYEQTEQLNISLFFERIFGRDDIYASDKIALASFCASLYNEGRILYIGDTDHDVTCAKTMHADCILISEGHQPFDLLQKTGQPIFKSWEKIQDYLDEEIS